MSDTFPALRCPVCRSLRMLSQPQFIVCGDCSRTYPVVDGVPDLRPDTSLDTRLNVVEYTALKQEQQEQSNKAYRVIWRKLFAEFLPGGEAAADEAGTAKVLEIACGSGMLTCGLAEDARFRHVCAVDISRGFIELAKEQLAQIGAEACFIQADANRLPFAPAGFNAIVGNSVLHHFLDYETTLEACHDLLLPGGIAIFGEPVIDGHVHIAFMATLMEARLLDGSMPEVTPRERQGIAALARLIDVKLSMMANPRTLAQQEDKWLFSVAGMQQLAERIGFCRFAVRGIAHFGSGQVRSHLLMRRRFTEFGVSDATLDRFADLFDAFDGTYGRLYQEKLITQYGYFVFGK